MSGPVEIRWPTGRQATLLPGGSRGWLAAVEGPIGVGKTTLARRLSQRLDAGLVLEVVEENPFLESFYRDIRGKAFQTQIFFLLSRHRQQRQLLRRLAMDEPIIADYMFPKDRLFAGLTLDGAELALYEQIYEAIAPQVPRPDVVVYLMASLDTLRCRIAERGRSFERDMTPDYLAELVEAYHVFFESYDEAPVIRVDTDHLDIREDRGLAPVAEAVVEARQ